MRKILSNHSRRNWLMVIVLSALMNFLYAQQQDNSPYSRLGLGDIKPYGFSHIIQMGGLSTAYHDVYHINIANPASYASLTAATFDFGINAKYSNLSQEGAELNRWSGAFDYISLAFPLSNTLNDVFDRVERNITFGMNFTVRQNTSVSYNIATSEFDNEIGVFERNYTGNGGTYELLWGNAVRYKDFSFGLNLSYLFGKIEYDNNIFFPDNPLAYNNIFSNEYTVGGFNYRLGTSYVHTLNKKEVEEDNKRAQRINFGATFGGGTKVNGDLMSSQIGFRNAGTNGIAYDTIGIDTIAGKIALPTNLSIGACYYSGDKWALGAEYTMDDWSKYFNDASKEVKGSLKRANRVSIGGYYRPNYKSYKFRDRVFYRFGFKYGTDPRVVDGEQLKYYAGSFGFGFPLIFQRKVSHANLGFEFGTQGTNAPIKENYFQVNFGFTFNDDEWFIKRKYN